MATWRCYKLFVDRTFKNRREDHQAMPSEFEILDAATYIGDSKKRRSELSSLIRDIFPRSRTKKIINSNKIHPKLLAVMKRKVCGNLIIGFVFWRVKKNTEGGKTAIIDRIGVRSGYRRRGIGTALISRSMSELKCHENPCDVLIHCRVSNDAKFFYDKLGFGTTRIIEQYYSDGEDAYEMMLRCCVPRQRTSCGRASFFPPY